MAKFKFTQQDLDDMIIKALQEPTQTQGAVQGATPKPAAMQKLLAQAQLKNNQPGTEQ
jgi:hypothetical protein